MTDQNLTLLRAADCLYARTPKGQMVRITKNRLTEEELDELVKFYTKKEEVVSNETS
jgi:hypothetical protein